MENTIDFNADTASLGLDDQALDHFKMSYVEAKAPVAAERSMLEKIKQILPQIAANAEHAEQLRKVPDENIALLKEIGFHRAFQPKAYGGLE